MVKHPSKMMFPASPDSRFPRRQVFVQTIRFKVADGREQDLADLRHRDLGDS